MDQRKTEEEITEELKESEVQETQPIEEDVPGPELEEEAAPQPIQTKPELPKKLVDEPKQIGEPSESRLSKLKAFIQECKRVLRVTKKPTREEYQTIVKISAIGMVLIGVLGFIIFLGKELLL